jgi:hypothetical protein
MREARRLYPTDLPGAELAALEPITSAEVVANGSVPEMPPEIGLLEQATVSTRI